MVATNRRHGFTHDATLWIFIECDIYPINDTEIPTLEAVLGFSQLGQLAITQDIAYTRTDKKT
jgi:hypothetical protein